VTTVASTSKSAVLFVIGRRREGHGAFLGRVERFLPKPPDRRVVSVRWNPPFTPVGRPAFLAALFEGFECADEDRLVSIMRSQLVGGNLVLVHQPVAEDAFERDDLVQYYTKWLPDIVDRADPGPQAAAVRGGVQAVQAVAWWPADGAARRAGTTEREARDMLRRVIAEQHPRLPVVMLRELETITPQDVEEWSATYLPPMPDRERLVALVTDGARDSAEILERMRELFGPDRRLAG
jgi:hypothetical protein